MKKQRIYLDTSVFGGLFDEEFKEFTEDELKFAPDSVKDIVNSLPKNSSEFVKSDVETVNLAKKYLDEKVVGITSFTDCLHIALATIHNANILVSWNFKHIVNVVRIIGYNSVNLAEGYKQIDIRSPRELINYED